MKLMVMIKDRNLSFLQFADIEDLNVLVDYMKLGKSPNQLDSFGECLSNNLALSSDKIIEELQTLGGSVLESTPKGFGNGGQYSVILRNVCKELEFNYCEQQSVEENECGFLKHILCKSLFDPNLSNEVILELLRTLDIDSYKTLGGRQAIGIAMASNRISSYQIAVIVSNAVSYFVLGKYLNNKTTDALLDRYMAIFADPINWVLSGVWERNTISGTVYRIAIPVVIQIACMRQKFNNVAYNYFR